MKELIILSPTSPSAVRTAKFANYLSDKGYTLRFWGWQRTSKSRKLEKNPYIEISYLLQGGGHGSKILPLYYCWFIIKLFFKLLFRKNKNNSVFLATNFETAFSVWLVSYFRNTRYIYDIWDEISISHNFHRNVSVILRFLDSKIRRKSVFYIHVDENRLSEIDSPNNIIIYNSPYDYFQGKRSDVHYENSFAVTGYLEDGRGMLSILEFAKANPDFKFIVVGIFINNKTKEKFLELNNVVSYDFMPQHELFKIIGSCRAIFSLYDTHIPIYRLAASNKLYDAMMLSIPVVVNKEVLASKFVEKYNIGYVVNYEPDDTWSRLVNDSLDDVREIGQNGRRVYEESFEFTTMMNNVLAPKLNEL